eukprot:3018110-Ditylum_brightwellii.AAC.1
MLTTKALCAPSQLMQSKHKPSPKVNQHWQPKMVSHSWMVLQLTQSTSTRIHYQGTATKGTVTKESPPRNQYLREKEV